MKKNNWLILFLLPLCLLFVFSLPVKSVAAFPNLKDAFLTNDKSAKDPLDSFASSSGYNIRSANSPFTVYTAITTIIQTILSIIGIIFLLLTVYGGILWMTAEGEEERVKKAQKIIRSAITGLIVVVSAYAISFFIVSALGSAIKI